MPTPTDPPPTLSFDRLGGVLRYNAGAWSIRGKAGPGWTSLTVGDAEFLHAPAAAPADHGDDGDGDADDAGHDPRAGAMAFALGDTLNARFPDASHIGAGLDGRHGGFGDGVFVLNLTPDPDRARCRLYAGFNDPRPRELLLYLADGVRLVRALDPDADRTWAPALAPADTLDGASLDAPHGALLVHRAGPAVAIDHPCRLAALPHPDGDPRPALAFPCNGFAANAVNLDFEPQPRAATLCNQPRFDVAHDRDGQVAGAAARGVGNPDYQPESRVDFKVRFDWLGDRPFHGRAELQIIHALGQTHFEQALDIVDAAGPTELAFSPRFSMPGASDVWARLYSREGQLLWVDRYRMFYDKERFQPDIRRPHDFDAFWKDTLDRMRSRPLNPTFTRVHEDYPDLELYDVTFNALADQPIHAVLSVPVNRDGPLPAIVASHPGTKGLALNKGPDGVYGSKLNRDPRFIQITPLIRGHALDAPDVPFNHPWWGPLDSPHDHAARYWFAAMTRAVDVLAARDDLVDMSRIIARGGSQGGALALAVAGLDDRIALCLADAPSNCQLHEIVTRYGTFGPSLGQMPEGQSIDQFLHTLSYVDPVNLCPSVRCPTCIGVTIGDLTVHSMGGLAAYRNLTALQPDQKALFAGPGNAHANPPEAIARFRELTDAVADGRPITSIRP